MAPRLTTFEVARWNVGAGCDSERRLLRHTITLDDGRVFTQEETLSVFTLQEPQVIRRTDWEEVPTPPVADLVIGFIDWNGNPMVVTQRGKAYVWAVKPGETAEENAVIEKLAAAGHLEKLPFGWVQFHVPVPGTPAFGEYNK